jgi:hypothetical protein
MRPVHLSLAFVSSRVFNQLNEMSTAKVVSQPQQNTVINVDDTSKQGVYMCCAVRFFYYVKCQSTAILNVLITG